jgi:hypothetical protein
MKKPLKHLLIAALVLSSGIGGYTLFESNAPAPPSVACPSGYLKTAYAYPVYTGKTDTVAGATADGDTSNIGCEARSITFTHDFTKISGTPTVTVACYVSANAGVTYDPTPIITFTVSPTTTITKTSVINAGNGMGNPYTTYAWTIAGSASSTISWKEWADIQRN